MATEAYREITGALGGILDELSSRAFNGNRRLVELREKLEGQHFHLVVMGQFKRGKSTLINALLGAEILPTAIVPLTSIVTRIGYGETPAAAVHYLDGRREEIPLTEIHRYVTERANPKNGLQVKEVEVFFPSPLLRDGVRIIDTPGVGSVFDHNIEVAYNCLPNLDAGIFVVTADPPLSASEHRFLREVRGYVDQLFFVMNKADAVGEKDLAEAISFTASVLEEDLRRTVKVWPVSARLALEARREKNEPKWRRSGLPAFEEHLRGYLHRGKGKTFLQSMTASLLRFVSDESMAWKLEQQAAKLTLEELRSKIDRFEDSVRRIERERDEHRFILNGRIRKLHESLDADLAKLAAAEIPRLQAELEGRFREKIRTARESRELESELEDTVYRDIVEVFSGFREQAARRLAEALEAVYLDLAERTNRTIAAFVELAATLFAVDLKPFTSVEKLTGRGDFYFLLRDDPDAIGLIRLGFRSALPLFVTRGLILRRIKAMAREIFERHCGRVRYDLVRRIDETTRKFQKSLDEKADLTLATIREGLERAVALKDRSETEVSRTLSHLDERLSAIDRIRNRLAAYRELAESL
ncbi:MAG: dynamin family protein [Desulfobacterales bacterium]